MPFICSSEQKIRNSELPAALSVHLRLRTGVSLPPLSPAMTLLSPTPAHQRRWWMVMIDDVHFSDAQGRAQNLGGEYSKFETM